MIDQPAGGLSDSPLSDRTNETHVDGNVTVEGHGRFTGRDDNSINVTDSPGAIVTREITVIQQIASGQTRRLTAVEDYLTAVREYCANLPYLTLHDIRPLKTLDEIYVPLKARPQLRKDEGESKEEQERLEREAFRVAPLSIVEVMQQQRAAPHVLILGEPGAGKSTLLRQMAECAWDTPHAIGLSERHLPLLIPLRLLASATGSLDERLNEVLKNELALPRALPDSFFDEWPQQTGAGWLVLLDALDEVPDSERARLMQWLKGQLSHLREQRVIITSRPTGYQNDFDTKTFGHYNLQPFTPEQADEFAHKWFNDKAESFLKELDRIRAGDLRGTPLLLTIAARVYVIKEALPTRRSALYLEFVEDWLAEANQDNRLNAELGERLAAPIEQHLERLAHLALCMMARPDGVQFERLCDFAAEYLQNEENFAPSHARSFGKRFVQIMARRSGVFLQQGSVYRFIHPTFLDFLAAYAAVRRSQYDPQTTWWPAISRWVEPNWQEVALFALDLLSDKDKEVTALVRRIWQHGGYYGVYFAWQALAEQVKVSQDLSDEIIRDIAERASDFTTWNSLRFPDPVELLCNLLAYPCAMASLLNLACNEKVFSWVRLRAAEALGRVGDKELARQAWVSVSRDPKMPAQFRKDAAQALGELGSPDDYAQAWLSLACDTHVDAWVRVEAAGRLSDTQLQTILDVLLTLARDQKVAVRAQIRAIKLLGRGGNVQIISNLIQIAQSGPDKHVRRAAREAAEQIRSRLGVNDAST